MTSTSSSSFDGKQFRKALGTFTTGVTIVTTRRADGVDAGLTANSFNSASLDPPMVLWSLGKNSSNLSAFLAAEHFAVHILAADQQDLSNRFAKSGTDKFVGLEVERSAHGVPLLSGCAARFECRTAYRYEGGDHVIFVGEVLSFSEFGHTPLVFHGGKYGLVMKEGGAAAEAGTIGQDFLGFLLRRSYDQLMVPLRDDLASRGFGEVHRHIVQVLSLGEGRDVEQVNSLLQLGGYKARPEDFELLTTRGLVRADAEGRLFFTDSGREFAIYIIAASKAAESDVLTGFDPHEVRVLKTLLQRLIANTEARVPAAWRRQSYRLGNNMWGVAAPGDASSGTQP